MHCHNGIAQNHGIFAQILHVVRGIVRENQALFGLGVKCIVALLHNLCVLGLAQVRLSFISEKRYAFVKVDTKSFHPKVKSPSFYPMPIAYSSVAACQCLCSRLLQSFQTTLSQMKMPER